MISHDYIYFLFYLQCQQEQVEVLLWRTKRLTKNYIIECEKGATNDQCIKACMRGVLFLAQVNHFHNVTFGYGFGLMCCTHTIGGFMY